MPSDGMDGWMDGWPGRRPSFVRRCHALRGLHSCRCAAGIYRFSKSRGDIPPLPPLSTARLGRVTIHCRLVMMGVVT